MSDLKYSKEQHAQFLLEIQEVMGMFACELIDEQTRMALTRALENRILRSRYPLGNTDNIFTVNFPASNGNGYRTELAVNRQTFALYLMEIPFDIYSKHKEFYEAVNEGPIPPRYG